MSESIFSRAQRVVRAGIETVLDKAEQASGASLLREAIREVDQSVADMTRQGEDARRRADDAAARRERLKKEHAELPEKARYALEKGRDDLAQAAIARQVEIEDELAAAETARADALVEARNFETLRGELIARRDGMETELAEFEKEARLAKVRAVANKPSDKAGRKMERADELFDRAKAWLERTDFGDGDTRRPEAEIDDIQREDEIARRMAKLKGSAAKPAKPRKTGRK